MFKIGILGSSGYAGGDLARLLVERDDIEILFLDSREGDGTPYSNLYPNLRAYTDQKITSNNIENKEILQELDVLFCALPHKVSQEAVARGLDAGCKVIDLSADFRLRDPEVYEAWYDTPHEERDILQKAVYGLPELHREEIKEADLIANPGCFPTGAILGLAPLLKHTEAKRAIVDSKTGVSGGGKGLNEAFLYCQANENTSAYAVGGHRHAPEMEQELSQVKGRDFQVIFTPHLVPMDRGILSTIYLENKEDLSQDQVHKLFEDFYKDEGFVRFLGSQAAMTKAVSGSNNIDISAVVDERTGHIIVTTAIDNLIKGASGQAVQNMNIMLGLDENKGLERPPIWP